MDKKGLELNGFCEADLYLGTGEFLKASTAVRIVRKVIACFENENISVDAMMKILSISQNELRKMAKIK